MPIVQLDTSYSATHYFFEFRDPTDPTSGGSESAAPILGRCEHDAVPSLGSFLIGSNSYADSVLLDPSSPYYDASLAGGGCGYRWL
jgi:hypothetical protein